MEPLQTIPTCDKTDENTLRDDVAETPFRLHTLVTLITLIFDIQFPKQKSERKNALNNTKTKEPPNLAAFSQ
ncbi:hypothetical protein [Vibrio paracholerae]|uniref:hypothetical protein n=1 Tax=Vibrio paracholerae TaxID=650003 RepID=UPI000DE1E23E|nr:hypothetical protein [Vibrio paracholerae]RBM59421.1 hypothetical protein DLR71_16260 [Vibrio paracholerae]